MPALRAVGLAATMGVLAACAAGRGGRPCGAPSPADELLSLRRAADSTGNSIRQSVDTMASLPRRHLQEVIDRVVTIERCGGLRAPERLRLAASTALAARTLGLPTVEKAYVWARAAVVLDSADRANWRVMALAWDELRVLQRRPQWFGTVVTCVTPILGRCSLAPVDSAQVSEALRVEFGLPTLQQQQVRVDSLNRIRGQP